MNPQNDILRLAYFDYLRGARGSDDKTVDAAMRYIIEFEEFNEFRDFASLTVDQARGFKQHVMSRPSQSGQGRLKPSTIIHILQAVKGLFQWLANTKKLKVSLEAIEYFEPPPKIAMAARSAPGRPVPTPEEIRMMLAALPSETMLQRRDRALTAFIYLTGIRVGALISIRCKHVDPVARRLNQDAAEVKTKLGKSMLTSWFPVGPDIDKIVIDWIEERRAIGVEADDPLFPRSPAAIPTTTGGDRASAFWTTAGPVRAIFRQACESAGLQQFNPHSFRKTLMQLGIRICLTFEELQAWSQNLGHEAIDTSLWHYGKLDDAQRDVLIQGLSQTVSIDEEEQFLKMWRAAPQKLRNAIRVMMEH